MKIRLIAMCLLLMGCSYLEQATYIQETGGTATTQSTGEEPPSLIFKVGDAVIKTDKGTYSWSFFDEKSKQTVTTLADHAPPTRMVNCNFTAHESVRDFGNCVYESGGWRRISLSSRALVLRCAHRVASL